jgi:hypothetical protein
MPTIRFIGRVYPPHLNLAFSTPVNSAIEILRPGTPLDGLDAHFNVGIKNSIVTVTCNVNRQESGDWGTLCACAYELGRAAVDMLAFSLGWGITLVMEKTEYEDGRVEALHYADPSLTGLCTAYKTEADFSDIYEIILSHRSIMAALNDITSTLESPFRTPVNCFRAVEAIAKLISPQLGPKDDLQRWQNMHAALNLSRSYLDPIAEHAKYPRHGNYWNYPSEIDPEIRQRTWTVMDRFLKFRKVGNLPLSEPEFRRLK